MSNVKNANRTTSSIEIGQLMMSGLSYISFRNALLVFSLALFAHGLWTVLPKPYHPRVIQLPIDPQTAALARHDQDKARRAASLGVIRGDLWAESAFTYADLIWIDAAAAADENAELDKRAETSLERALKYSPHRGDAWLMLAALADRRHWPGYQPSSLLKMSYYTAPNELSLLPLRLTVALRSQSIEDPELQDMVRRDIRVILTRIPTLRSALVAAYKIASGPGKAFIESAVSEADPSFLQTIRAK